MANIFKSISDKHKLDNESPEMVPDTELGIKKTRKSSYIIAGVIFILAGVGVASIFQHKNSQHEKNPELNIPAVPVSVAPPDVSANVTSAPEGVAVAADVAANALNTQSPTNQPQVSPPADLQAAIGVSPSTVSLPAKSEPAPVGAPSPAIMQESNSATPVQKQPEAISPPPQPNAPPFLAQTANQGAPAQDNSLPPKKIGKALPIQQEAHFESAPTIDPPEPKTTIKNNFAYVDEDQKPVRKTKKKAVKQPQEMEEGEEPVTAETILIYSE